MHVDWKIRKDSYKEISDKFLNYDKSKDQSEQESEGGKNPFELYGHYLEKIISDSNLIA